MTDGEAGEHVAHFLPSVIRWRWGGAPPAAHLPPPSVFLPSVILGASPGIQALPFLLSVRREGRRRGGYGVLQQGFTPTGGRPTDT